MNSRLGLYGGNFTWLTSSIFENIDCAAERGMSVYEVYTSKELITPDKEFAKRLRAYADEKGVRICCVSCYTSLTPENAEIETQRLKDYVDVTKILGSPYFHHTIVSSYATPEDMLHRKEELFQNAIEVIRNVYDYAAPLGVRLVYEDQGYLFNGVENFRRFLNTVDRDVGVVLDFGNHYHVDEPLDGFLDAFADRVCHAHIKDVLYADTPDGTAGWAQTLHGKYFKVVPMGDGIMNHKAYIDKLEKTGYKGCYTIEFASTEEDRGIVDRALDKLNQWLA